MKKKSQILEFIKNNPDDWKKKLEEKKINIKIDDENFVIFNYGIGVDFHDPLVREARGIIIDLDSLKVVCRGFDKFFNSVEVYAREDVNNFDWGNCRVEDKIDGSIIKLYFRPFKGRLKEEGLDGRWCWATNSCINAFEAMIGNTGKSFGNIIESAVNFNIPFWNLNKDSTYIFELVSPETQVVIHYNVPKLYHIGTRNSITGEEYDQNIGIEKPRIYNIHTLADCLKAANELNPGNTEIKKEGFVAVDKNWRRLKIKSPKYLQLHHVWNNGMLSKRDAYDLLMDYDVHELDADGTISKLSVILRYYDYKIKEFEYNVARYIDYVRGLYEEFGHDRKAVASTISSHKYKSFGFKAIGNEDDAGLIMNRMNKAAILRFIPEYVEENVYE